MIVHPEERINIRASGLSGAPDCFRRWAAGLTSLRPMLKRFGYELGESKNNAGNVIGRACHEGIGAIFQAQFDGKPHDPYVTAIEVFRKESQAFWHTDRETPDAETAEKQISRMVHAYAPFAQTLKIARFEFYLEACLDTIKQYYITGHPDMEITNGDIRDMKFGKRSAPYEAQLGMYLLMKRSNGGDPKGGLFVDWVKRGSLKTKQQELVTYEYDPNVAENAAYYLADTVMNMIEKFKETGNPWAFPANNNSMLCSKKWCHAHSTPFCNMGRKSATDDD